MSHPTVTFGYESDGTDLRVWPLMRYPHGIGV